MPKRIVSVPDRSYLCHNDTWLNSTMPLRLNALLCRSYTCPCQCSATPLLYYSVPLLRHSLHYYSMPKHSIPLLCPSSAYLRLALAPRFFSLPSLCISPHYPRSTLLSQNHAPLSHGNTLPGPFIAIQCLYFTMPVLTSRCSASATRHLASTQLIFTVPSPCRTLPSLERAIQCPCFEAHCHGCSTLFDALAPLIPASPLLVNAFALLYLATASQFNSAS